MNKISYYTFAITLFLSSSAWSVDVSKIYGNIQIVNAFPDYKVKVVHSSADLDVKVGKFFPDSPGKWKMVTSFPDYKVQFVDSFADFTIRYVEAFPGPH